MKELKHFSLAFYVMVYECLLTTIFTDGKPIDARLDFLENTLSLVLHQNQRLEDIVKRQEIEISELKQQMTDIKQLKGIQNLLKCPEVKHNSSQDAVLKEIYLEKEKTINSEDEVDKGLRNKERISEYDNHFANEGRVIQTINSKRSNAVNKSEIGPTKRLSNQVVAFYAYLSQDEKAPNAHHTIVFDIARTNVQGKYNVFSGMFTVPVDGVYVFNFSIHMGCNAYGSYEIVKNADVIGAVYLDVSEACDSEQVTYDVVIEANTNDVVFVRTHSTRQIYGDIISNSEGRSSFAGCLLA